MKKNLWFTAIVLVGVLLGMMQSVATAEATAGRAATGTEIIAVGSTDAGSTAQSGNVDRTMTFENDKVKIWKLTLTPGKPIPLGAGNNDSVLLILEGGKFQASTSGKKKTETRPAGDAIYSPAGQPLTEQLLSQTPIPAYLVELKGGIWPLLPNHSGYPLAYPRPGAKKVLDNDRIVVWNFPYTVGKQTATHFHDKDAVVIFRFEGSIASITPDGKSTVTDDKAGEARFSPAARVHSEELVKGRESVIVVELK